VTFPEIDNGIPTKNACQTSISTENYKHALWFLN